MVDKAIRSSVCSCASCVLTPVWLTSMLSSYMQVSGAVSSSCRQPALMQLIGFAHVCAVAQGCSQNLLIPSHY